MEQLDALKTFGISSKGIKISSYSELGGKIAHCDSQRAWINRKEYSRDQILLGLSELNAFPLVMPVTGDPYSTEDSEDWRLWLKAFERHQIEPKHMAFGFEMKEPILTKNAPQPIGPYSQAIKYDNMLFISGQIPMNPETEKLVDSGIADETTQVMKNLEAVLIESGMSFKDVVKTTIFLKSMDDFALVNSEYGKSFEGSTPPARETVEVSKLPLNVNVEISCIAIKK